MGSCTYTVFTIEPMNILYVPSSSGTSMFCTIESRSNVLPSSYCKLCYGISCSWTYTVWTSGVIHTDLFTANLRNLYLIYYRVRDPPRSLLASSWTYIWFIPKVQEIRRHLRWRQGTAVFNIEFMNIYQQYDRVQEHVCITYWVEEHILCKEASTVTSWYMAI